MRRNFPSAFLKNMLLLSVLKASLTLPSSLPSNPLNHSQELLRHQNHSKAILKLGDLLLCEELNQTVLKDRS